MLYATYSFQKSTLNCEVMLEFQKLETLMHIVEDEIVMVPVQVKGRLVEEGVVLPHKLTTFKVIVSFVYSLSQEKNKHSTY